MGLALSCLLEGDGGSRGHRAKFRMQAKREMAKMAFCPKLSPSNRFLREDLGAQPKFEDISRDDARVVFLVWTSIFGV